MAENRTRRILTWVACALGVVLLLTRLNGSEAGSSWAVSDAQIHELREKIRMAPDAGEADKLQCKIDRAQRFFDLPIPARQEYLDSLIGDQFISRFNPGQPVPAPQWLGKQVVAYQFTLRLTLEDLWDVLDRLDADSQPMRVEHLRIRSQADADRTLQVDLTLAMLADVARSATPTATAPAAPPSPPAIEPQPTSRPARKNIFFPIGLIARTPTPRADTAIRPFTLVGVEADAPTPRVLVHLADTGESMWVEKGMTVAGVQLADVGPDAAAFALGPQLGRLQVGQTSGRLLLGKRSFKTPCTIVAIVNDQRQPLALARFEGRPGHVYLAEGDVLHGGKIVAIGSDSITVDYGYPEVVRVGQASDRPYFPGMTSE